MPPSDAYPTQQPAQLRVDGTWLWSIDGFGDLSWETRMPGGMHEITWSMPPTKGRLHPALHNGALVELRDGPWPLGLGTLYQPDATAGDYVARGLYRQAEQAICLDPITRAATSVPDKAITRAITDGIVNWLIRDSVSSLALSGDGTTTGVNYLSTLLDIYSDQTSSLWYVDEFSLVHNLTIPTTPDYLLHPGLTDLGKADDDYASDLYGRRLASSGTYDTRHRTDTIAAAALGPREAPVDLTSYGTLSTAKADAILDGILRKGRGRPKFTKDIEVTADQLITTGGVPADLRGVKAGEVVRSLDLFDDALALNGQTWLDWVIGATKYADGAPSITLTPFNRADRGLQHVLANAVPSSTFVA